MASPCGGLGMLADGRTRCPQCKGMPSSDPECSEAQRRGPGADASKLWESSSFFTMTGKSTIRHPLGRVPVLVEPIWERQPRFKAATAGDPESVADYIFKVTARTTTTVEVEFTVNAKAEPGSYRLKVSG